MQIPTIDLVAQYRSIQKEIDDTVKRVFSHSHFVLGEELGRFEERLARYIGVKYALGVASGTDALFLSLFALGVKEGDEVITTPFTFGATAEVVALLKAKPVFVDIDAETFNIDIERIEDAVSDRTRAIIPVHLYGLCADMHGINEVARRHNLKVIEDAAQAVGSRIGSKKAGCFGHVTGLSFYPTKNLGAAGDGGAILSDDEALFERIKILRVHGIEEKYHYRIIGFNNRLDTVQAAVLLVKLDHLDAWNGRRREIARRYTEGLKAFVKVPVEPEGFHSVYHQYTIRTERREELKEYLGNHGVGAAIHYPAPLHLQPAFSYLDHKKGDFPEAEKAAQEVLSLPMYPELSDEQVSYVIAQVNSFFKG
jgi:dTDP-4-amino-4,6-dideoxygalactose transaminase